MPITDDEFEDGATHDARDSPETDPVSEYETEKDLVLAFLSENVGTAFTRAEIVRGVDFGDSDDPATVTEVLTGLPNELVDVAGDLTASALVVGDVEEALDELVGEGLVETEQVETDEGPVTYYRLSG